MKTKTIYTTPEIEILFLDNDISLALESSPPEGPDEGYNKNSTPDYFNNNPLDIKYT